MPALRSWRQALLARGWRHALLVLTLVLAANAWVLNPTAGWSAVFSDTFNSAPDSAAILGAAEDAEASKSQADDPDQSSYAFAYPEVADHASRPARAAPDQAVKSRDRDAFPHKTGPPART